MCYLSSNWNQLWAKGILSIFNKNPEVINFTAQVNRSWASDDLVSNFLMVTNVNICRLLRKEFSNSPLLKMCIQIGWLAQHLIMTIMDYNNQ